MYNKSNPKLNKVSQLKIGDKIAAPKLPLFSFLDGSGFENSINYDSYCYSQEATGYVEECHSNYYSKSLINIKLADQNTTANPIPKIMDGILSAINPEIKNGTTIEAKNIWPTLATIPESDFIWREVNFNTTTLNDNNLETDVKWEAIISIDYVGYEQVYDISVENTHNSCSSA